jgi:hypothetical protein
MRTGPAHYTHTMVVRDELTGRLVSTTLARVNPDGAVIDMAGHFAYGRGSILYDDIYRSVVAHEAALGHEVELVHDDGAMHRARLRELLLPPTYTRGALAR